jgi:hypothetical protein
MAQFNFLDANGLNYYHGLLKTYIDNADAQSIKYITFLPEGNAGNSPTTINFYKEDPTSTPAPSPAYTITLPNFEATYQHLVSGSHQDEVVILDANGQVTYSGVTLEELAAASGSGVASKTVYITVTAGGTSDLYSKRYGIYQGATGSSASPVASEKLTDIDIPKDMVVESGTVETVTTQDVPYPGAQVGDKYIDLILANATSSHVYIPVKDLVDTYTGGTTTDGTITISASNEITFTLSQTVHGSLTLADNSVQKGWSSTTPTSGNIMAFGANGVAVDGGIATSAIVVASDLGAISDATIDAIVAGTYTPAGS